MCDQAFQRFLLIDLILRFRVLLGGLYELFYPFGCYYLLSNILIISPKVKFLIFYILYFLW
jgi:hypothetical protein